MAYIPSWAETYFPQLQQSFQQIGKIIAPDYYAQETFKQLAQQDPTLVSRLSNMDDGERQVYSKNVLGARNKNPLESIGIGSERKAREDRVAAIKLLTPDELKSMQNRDLGVTSQADLDRKKVVEGQQDTSYGLNVSNAQQNLVSGQQAIDLNDFKFEDLKKSRAKLDEAMAAYPTLKGINIGHVAAEAVYGRGDANLITMIQQDQGANELYESAKKQKVDEIAASYSMRELMQRERNTRDRPKKEVINADMQVLGQSLNEAQQELSRATTNITKTLESNSILRNYLNAKPEDKKELEKFLDPSVIQSYQVLVTEKNAREFDVRKYYTAKNDAANELDRVKAAEQKLGASPTLDNSQPSSAAISIEGAINSKELTLDQALLSAALSEVDKTYLKRKFGK